MKTIKLQNKWVKPVLISALLFCSSSIFATDELAGILAAVKDNFGLARSLSRCFT